MEVIAVMSLIIAIVGLVYAALSAKYAKKAFEASKIISFPDKDPKEQWIEITNYSKEGRDFEDFIFKNRHSRVYINVRFDADKVTVVLEESTPWFLLWQEQLEPLNEGDQPSVMNSSGFNVSVEMPQGTDAGLYWNRGFYELTGFFSILGYGGPHQGLMGATLRAEKIS